MATRPQVSKSSPYVPRYVKASSRIRSLCQALGHCGRAKKASKKRKKYASSNKRREQKTDTYSSRRFSRFFFLSVVPTIFWYLGDLKPGTDYYIRK